MGSSPTRGSSFFLGKVTALGVLCCFALLFVSPCLLLSSFLLISLYQVSQQRSVLPTGSSEDADEVRVFRIEETHSYHSKSHSIALSTVVPPSAESRRLFMSLFVCCLCLQVDGKRLDLPDVEGVVFLNIQRFVWLAICV